MAVSVPCTKLDTFAPTIFRVSFARSKFVIVSCPVSSPGPGTVTRVESLKEPTNAVHNEGVIARTTGERIDTKRRLQCQPDGVPLTTSPSKSVSVVPNDTGIALPVEVD